MLRARDKGPLLTRVSDSVVRCMVRFLPLASVGRLAGVSRRFAWLTRRGDCWPTSFDEAKVPAHAEDHVNGVRGERIVSCLTRLLRCADPSWQPRHVRLHFRTLRTWHHGSMSEAERERNRQRVAAQAWVLEKLVAAPITSIALMCAKDDHVSNKFVREPAFELVARRAAQLLALDFSDCESYQFDETACTFLEECGGARAFGALRRLAMPARRRRDDFVGLPRLLAHLPTDLAELDWRGYSCPSDVPLCLLVESLALPEWSPYLRDHARFECPRLVRMRLERCDGIWQDRGLSQLDAPQLSSLHISQLALNVPYTLAKLAKLFPNLVTLTLGLDTKSGQDKDKDKATEAWVDCVLAALPLWPRLRTLDLAQLTWIPGKQALRLAVLPAPRLTMLVLPGQVYDWMAAIAQHLGPDAQLWRQDLVLSTHANPR